MTTEMRELTHRLYAVIHLPQVDAFTSSTMRMSNTSHQEGAESWRFVDGKTVAVVNCTSRAGQYKYVKLTND